MASEFKFDDLMEQLRETLDGLPDYRTGNNTVYSIKDAASGALGVFFTQAPSFLAYQRDLERRQGNSNAHTLLQMEQIPSDNQIRNLLDPIEPRHLFEMFDTIFEQFSQTEEGQAFRAEDGSWLVGLDGTQHFSSTKIHCDNCERQQQADGTTRYSHQVLSAIVVNPEHNQVISLAPEFIEPQPGHDRQDCERMAAHRWIRRQTAMCDTRDVTLLGDALYATQPTCQLALDHGFDFIFVAKSRAHPTLYEWLDGLDQVDDGLPTFETRRWNGKFNEIWRYRYANQVPLRRGADALYVNWVELTIFNARTGEQLYRCAFVTNQRLTEETVPDIVRAGRARWKNENEHNNVLKNHGYHLEHNFGHGEQHLSNFLVTLNLLAFLFHTLFSMFDETYQAVRKELGARRTFFNDIRALTRYLIFDSWDQLLAFMYQQLEIDGASAESISLGHI
jgi:hypothetical protein